MANDGSIIIDSRIDTKGLKKDLTNLNRSITGAFKSIAKGAVAGLAVATAAVTGFAASSVKEFAVFESGMNEVFTLLPGITEDAMKSMEKDVLSFSKKMKTLPEDVVPALYQAISAGVPKENVFTFLEVAQKAAKGGVTDLTTAVDGISSVVNAYGEEIIDATMASDLMFTAVKNGKTSFEELSASLFQVIPTASALGVEFGNVTAALATMTATGVPTSVATTQLRSLMTELSKEGGKAADTFKKLSGKTFKDFIKEGGNLQEALKLMEDGAADLDIGINDLFSSVEAGGAALSLTGEATDAFTKNLEDMQDSADATDEAYNIMNTGISTAIDSLKANFSALKIQVGEKLAPEVEKLANKFAEFIGEEENVDKITNIIIETFDNLVKGAKIAWDVLVDGVEIIKDVVNWMKEHNEITKTLAITIGVLTAIVTAYNVVTTLAAVATAAFHVAALPLTGPIILIIAGITGLVAILVIFKDTIVDAAQMVGRMMLTMMFSVDDAIGSMLNFFAGLIDSMVSYFNKGVENITEFANDMVAAIKDGFSTVTEIGRDIVRGIWDGILEMKDWFGGKIKNFFSNTLGGAKRFLGINSPSKLFRDEIGVHMASGVGVGFDKKFKDVDSSIMKNMQGLTSSLSSNVSEGMQTGSSVNNNQSSVTNNLEGMFDGAKFEVRSIADIKNIASEVSRSIRDTKVNKSRGLGYAG